MGLMIIARKYFALHQIFDNRIDYIIVGFIMTSFRRPDSLCIIPYTQSFFNVSVDYIQ